VQQADMRSRGSIAGKGGGGVRAASRVMIVAGVLFTATSGLYAAETAYPTKPIRMVVNFAPGGGTDIVARAVAQKFTEVWGQSVIVDNRAGGNGNIGADVVAKANPDGYTLLVATNSAISINPHLQRLPYDPVKDFAPISQIATLPFVLVVHPSVPAKTIPELIALARARPGQLNYGSSGSGGGAHLSGELLKVMAKLDVTHVPYKGGAPALIALVGGQVQYMFISILTVTPLIESNKVRVLGVTSPKRSPALPNVPAMAETPGLVGFEADLWYGMLAPARTDPRIVDRLQRETSRVIALKEIRDRFEPTGTLMVGNTPAEFAKIISSDLQRWSGVIKASGAKLD